MGLPDIKKLVAYRAEGVCKSVRFLVDPSFDGRNPQRAVLLRELLGADNVIERECHAKFAILLGGEKDALYSTSMNMAQDSRVDAGTVVLNDKAISEYAGLINDVLDGDLPASFAYPALKPDGLADLGIERGFVDHLSTGWDYGDMIGAVTDRLGSKRITLATWTLGTVDMFKLKDKINDGSYDEVRFLLDRSFHTRHKKMCEEFRDLFGDDAIRIVNSHAKFVVFEGGSDTAVYSTSANCNRNKRIENATLFVGGDVPAAYIEFVDDPFTLQAPGEGFESPKTGRQTTDAWMKKGGEEVLDAAPASSEYLAGVKSFAQIAVETRQDLEDRYPELAELLGSALDWYHTLSTYADAPGEFSPQLASQMRQQRALIEKAMLDAWVAAEVERKRSFGDDINDNVASMVKQRASRWNNDG